MILRPRLSFFNRAGFTLIELLVVIGIIAILAAVGIASYSKVQSQARDVRRRSDAKELRAALELYQVENNIYPVTSACPNGTWCPSSDPAQWENGPLAPLVVGNFIAALPKDPKNTSPNPELIYWVKSDGARYCIQISQEHNVTTDPAYIGFWNSVWILRFGDRAYC